MWLMTVRRWTRWGTTLFPIPLLTWGCEDAGSQAGPLRPELLKFEPARDADSRHSAGWIVYRLNPQRLDQVWGRPESPWRPFHKSTLITFLGEPEVANYAKPVYTEAMARAEREAHHFSQLLDEMSQADRNEVAVFVDLPGVEAVVWGAVLARELRMQPVLTFNNIPHQQGVLAHEHVLGALLYYAQEVEQQHLPLEANPVFLADAQRFAPRRTVGRDEFDNRYYLVPTDLPSASQFQARGIKYLVYLTHGERREQDDLNPYFIDLSTGNAVQVTVLDPTQFRDVDVERARTLAKEDRERAGATTAGRAGVTTGGGGYYGSSPVWWYLLGRMSSPGPLIYTTPAPTYQPYRPERRETVFTGGSGWSGGRYSGTSWRSWFGGGFGGSKGLTSGGGGA
ncbi:MAG: hypothetical protein HYZ81_14475 [Nitrospinae bacterium]|nr:hypothetical protein [Nitrospinota bacterium]